MSRPEEMQERGTGATIACPRCGTQNRPGARWCASCAQPLDAAPSTPAAAPPPQTETTNRPSEAPPAPSQPSPAPPAPAPTQPAATPPPPTTTAPRPVTSPPPAPSSSQPPPAAPPRPAPSTPSSTAPIAPPARPAPAVETRPTAPPARPPTAPAPARPGAAPSRGLVTLLAIACVVLFITTVLFGLMAFSPSSAPIKNTATRAAAQASSQEEITKAASRFTGSLVTFDYRTLDADIQRIQRDATGNFRNQFHTALGGDLNVFRRAIQGSQAQSTGDVKGTSVSSRDENTATVLVFVSQTIRNKSRPAPRTELRLLELTLVKTPQGWKVDNVGNPARSQ